MSLGVWAEARDAPGSICWDARLRGMKDETRDATYGQAGWHVGVGFVTLGDLVSRLAGMKLPHFTCGNYVFDCPPLHDYQIRRLAIHCHGVEGKLYVDGKQLDRDYGPIWDDLTELPWASETSRHAKVAQNGEIIHGKNLTW